MCWNRLLCIAAAVVSVACVRENAVEQASGGLQEVEVDLMLSGTGMSGLTRSILQEDSIESLVTDITLASYGPDGKLTNVLYYGDVDGPVSLYVEGNGPNDVFALVNMGDMTSSFPSSKADVGGIVYSVGSYDQVAERGIPMCGVLEGYVYQRGTLLSLKLERLFARLNVRILHTGLTGGQNSDIFAYNLANRSLHLRQANRTLMPFDPAGSRALSSEDVMHVSDYNSDMSSWEQYQGSLKPSDVGPGLGYVKDTTIVLYVPENVQGCLLPENEDPYEKVADRIGELEDGRYKGLCTYLEYHASKPDNGTGYYGDVMYRCYLGEDNVSDFSVRRNSRYDLVMNFTDEGFFMDGWKVTRGDNWVDNRMLYFVDEPFVIYPGTALNVPVHYNRINASADTDSYGPVSDWTYEFDEEAMAEAGLLCTFMGSEKVKGKNGRSDFYFRITASEDAKVGTSIPIKVSLKDGSKADVTTVNVSEVGELTPVWDFVPQYVAQTGEMMLGGAVQALLPVTVHVSDPSVLECVATGDASFRFTALKEGSVNVVVSNTDGSQTLEFPLTVKVPVLKVSDIYVALAPDGEKGRLDYCYTDAEGNPLANFDDKVYARNLAPVVMGCEYIGADVAKSYIDLYISKLYASGQLLNVGSYYGLALKASNCPSVREHTLRAYVIDPFSNVETVSVSSIEDYTLLGLTVVPAKVKEYFSSELSSGLERRYEIPPVDADARYISSSVTPLWMDAFSYENGVYGSQYTHSDRNSSKGASVRIFQNTVYSSTSHSAGKHSLELHVSNRYSNEKLTRSLAVFDVYVHSVIGAAADFGYKTCSSPSGGTGGAPTVAGIYNSLAGMTLYGVTSSKMIYYMDVSMEFLCPVDKVYVFDKMQEGVASGRNVMDGMDWVRPSVSDGYLDHNQRFLYSVCAGGGQRVAICGESYGYRKGVETVLYRAVAFSEYGATLSDTRLKQLFFGYSTEQGGGSALYAPAFDMHDMNLGTDMTRNVVSKSRPYYFSPASCASFRDSAGRGYHVVHTLNQIAPSTCGWTNLL